MSPLLSRDKRSGDIFDPENREARRGPADSVVEAAVGRDPGWRSLEEPAEPGGKRHRRLWRRFGSAKAVIDVDVWDGPDLSPEILPALRRAAAECARLLAGSG